MSHANKEEILRVLIDMDGVLCDFESHLLDRYRELHPGDPHVDLEKRNTFYPSEQYEALKPGLASKVHAIVEEHHFFLNLPEIRGAINAVKEMSMIPGLEVFICSTPLTSSPIISAAEKYEWIEMHMGLEWMRRIILTRDKTMIHGDILIDDRHSIVGSLKHPTWDHILFTQCHNVHLPEEDLKKNGTKSRLENWTDGSWRTLVQQYMDEKQKMVFV